jgi:methylated-DNA-[protein]-cysteine S-methyltransferase
MTTSHTIIDTRMGDLTLVATGGVLTGVYHPGHWTNPDRTAFGPRCDEGFEEAERQLGEYLAGERTEFGLPTSATGDTFKQRVWALLNRIPYGETTTYGELAATAGAGLTAQQVGAMVGRNPLSIAVPCHRVVGRNGKLTGYAGGITRKRLLLDLEHEYATGTPTLWGA